MFVTDKLACKAFQEKDIKPTWTKPFPTIGKGTLLFNIARSTPFYIIVRDNPLKSDIESWIGLTVSKERVSFLDKINGGAPQTLCEATSSEFFGSNVGIEPEYICTYWLSYDRDRMVIKYGKGYRMEKTTILEYTFANLEKEKREEIRRVFFDPKVDRFVELYDEQPWETPKPEMMMNVALAVDETKPMTAIGDVEKEVDFDPVPFVSDLSYLVKDSSTVDLFDLDNGEYMYSASLPPECQILYDNITAANVDLDYQGTDPNKRYDFKLSDAIRYSIDTDGCILNEKLKSKAGEFGKEDLAKTYLRVTLGKDYGNSPGIPYVLELWPKGHGSPVHNHGNAYALIRVLHGGLTVRYFNKVSQSVLVDNEASEREKERLEAQRLGQFPVKKGDVTWLSPNWYQTHQLWNDTNDYCATVQCYQYGQNDNMHWPYFDYIKSCDIIEEFTPDSDYSFTEMYNRVMKEYANRPQNN